MSSDLQSGFAALQTGNAQRALEIARAGGDDPNARYLEGLALRALGDSQAALDVFRALGKAHPQVADFANLEGLCAGDLDDVAGARAAFGRAVDAHAGFYNAPFNLGRLLADKGELAEAAEAFHQALAIKPDHLPSLRNLAHVLEQAHAYEAAEEAADAALKLAGSDPLALAVKAGALTRKQAYGEAADLITRQLKADAPAINAALALGRKGEALEKDGAFDAAFGAFAAANQKLKQKYAVQYNGVTNGFALDRVKALSRWPGVPVEAETGCEGPAPVFLVGFPRSGTTLVENVLAAHPDITTSDEAELSAPLIEAAGDTPEDWLAFMEAMPEKRAALRAAYWEGWTGAKPGAGQVFIDKLPLNLAYVGLLSAVFPDAKFILSIRDPRDCVLSAFKQRFGMNAAMFRMLTMPGAASYYDAAMLAGTRALDRVPPGQQRQVKYEDCVADLEGQTRQLVEFLGLAWSDDVMAYREKAKARAISTPSASQVVQPVYDSSAGRWKDYAGPMQGVRSVLDPWAQRWGYEV
ncbi:sulfotransferase [Hyphobacterium sp. HN65]|uniref:Sulfotransferase n=1 Tax=Hyphobacterium lacteum TaxID=3116575 RepID=A0ABU7LTR1_9PROT|nr:sulfotransferase [Hyphobacterium sp. HN65]MEE2527278.1 sulfotransferase [Hyphobacterium sp. HN65]